MVDARLKLIAAFVILCAAIAVTIYWTLRATPATFAPARCRIGNSVSETIGALHYNAKIYVKVQINDSDTQQFRAFATRASPLTQQEAHDFINDYKQGSTVPCWWNQQTNRSDFLRTFGKVRLSTLDGTRIRDDHEALKTKTRVIVLIMAIASTVSLAILLIYMFRAELVRCCPRCILTFAMNFNSRINRLRRRAAPPPPTPPSIPAVTRPPAITSRKRISSLIENAKLPESEVRAMHAEGWTCCICLEEQEEGQKFPSVSRLECNHATHSDCLRSWLEKGRAVCCLCNAQVFPDSAKDTAISSGRSSISVDEHGANDSLVVEQTEETPSSPGTSIVMEVSVAAQPLLDPITITRFNERNM